MEPRPAKPRLCSCSAGNAGRLLLRGGAQKPEVATLPQHGVVRPNHCLQRRAVQPPPVSEQCSLPLVPRRLCSGRLCKLALACHTPAGGAQQGSRPSGCRSQQQAAIPCPLLWHACPLQAATRQCEGGCRPTPLAMEGHSRQPRLFRVPQQQGRQQQRQQNWWHASQLLTEPLSTW